MSRNSFSPYYVAVVADVGRMWEKEAAEWGQSTGRKSIRTVCVYVHASVRVLLCLYARISDVRGPCTRGYTQVATHTLRCTHQGHWAPWGPHRVGGLAGREWVRESTPICIRLHNNGGRLYPLGHIRVVVVVVVEKSRRRDPPIRFQCSQIMFSICCRVGLFVCLSLFLLLHSLGMLAALAWPYNLICIQVEWWLRVTMSTGAGLCVSFGPILESRCCLRCGAKQ